MISTSSKLKQWRIIDLIKWIEYKFNQNGVTNSKLEAEWLICNLLEVISAISELEKIIDNIRPIIAKLSSII